MDNNNNNNNNNNIYNNTPKLTREMYLKALKKGKTPDQKKAIGYFTGEGGCFSKVIKDEQYDQMVEEKLRSINFKQRAIEVLGIDPEQINEIAPIHFEGFDFSKAILIKQGNDDLWRSSAYEITWLFFSDTQIYVYQHTFHMESDAKEEKTMEYFYDDITSFSVNHETIDKPLPKKNCMGAITYEFKPVDYTAFYLTVPSASLLCSMVQNDYTDRAIEGMKAKLREKKNY